MEDRRPRRALEDAADDRGALGIQQVVVRVRAGQRDDQGQLGDVGAER